VAFILLGFLVSLSFFYFSNDMSTKIFSLAFVIVPVVFYVDDRFYSGDIRNDFGCIVKKNSGYNSSPYLIIDLNGEKTDFSMTKFKRKWDSNYIGGCFEIYYYEDIFGYRILIDIEKQGELNGKL